MRALTMLRGLVYRLGFQPRLGAVLHSPSLSLRHAFRDADVAGATADALRNGAKGARK